MKTINLSLCTQDTLYNIGNFATYDCHMCGLSYDNHICIICVLYVYSII